jgi:transient receptor potential cation channel subfamily M protein 3
MRPLYEDQQETEGNTDAEYIYRDLFLWCILTYRLDMAKIFLSQLKTRICSALIASKILKSLADYAPDQVAKDTLYSKADDFETHAVKFIQYAYINDKHQACELIMRSTNLYGGVTCLQMAIAADDKKFLHEDACQALLTNIWYDKVDPVRERNRLVINILTFGISQLFISIYQKYFSKCSSVKPENHVG